MRRLRSEQEGHTRYRANAFVSAWVEAEELERHDEEHWLRVEVKFRRVAAGSRLLGIRTALLSGRLQGVIAGTTQDLLRVFDSAFQGVQENARQSSGELATPLQVLPLSASVSHSQAAARRSTSSQQGQVPHTVIQQKNIGDSPEWVFWPNYPPAADDARHQMLDYSVRLQIPLKVQATGIMDGWFTYGFERKHLVVCDDRGRRLRDRSWVTKALLRRDLTQDIETHTVKAGFLLVEIADES